MDLGLDETHRDNAGWKLLPYRSFTGNRRSYGSQGQRRTIAHVSGQEGHLSVVERLIKLGADIDQKSFDGKTPLRKAALEGHITDLSVEAGADVIAKDPDRNSTLYLLAIEKKMEQVEIIPLNSTGKYNLKEDRDLEQRTPLHIAIQQGHMSMLELLLRYGADVNAVDREQRTPSQSLACQGHESVFGLLLKAGARGVSPVHRELRPSLSV